MLWIITLLMACATCNIHPPVCVVARFEPQRRWARPDGFPAFNHRLKLHQQHKETPPGTWGVSAGATGHPLRRVYCALFTKHPCAESLLPCMMCHSAVLMLCMTKAVADVYKMQSPVCVVSRFRPRWRWARPDDRPVHLPTAHGDITA